jgi:NAD-dependent deacetylase sirtuin 4
MLGVPDYRGPEGSYKLGHKPIVHDDFMSKEASRKRYWARSMMGWKEFAEAKPNPGENMHVCL